MVGQWHEEKLLGNFVYNKEGRSEKGGGRICSGEKLSERFTEKTEQDNKVNLTHFNF